MPAGQSIIGIYNIALGELGEDPATAITDNSKGVIWCNARYNDSRQAVIRMHPWNCTKKFTALAANPVPPPFKWSNAYDLPGDFIRMFDIPDDPEANWEIVGSQLYADNTAPLNIRYHFDLQDTTRFDALFARVVGLELALEIGPPIIRDDAKMVRIQKKLEAKILTATLVDSQEDSPREWDEDVLLRSRR